ncbi:hypothetical protein J6590_041395 [Homalodisca vitripennis]|nr:hypothetical protein J6590_041395 [Homalodisca vitripennis]
MSHIDTAISQSLARLRAPGSGHINFCSRSLSACGVGPVLPPPRCGALIAGQSGRICQQPLGQSSTDSAPAISNAWMGIDYSSLTDGQGGLIVTCGICYRPRPRLHHPHPHRRIIVPNPISPLDDSFPNQVCSSCGLRPSCHHFNNTLYCVRRVNVHDSICRGFNIPVSVLSNTSHLTSPLFVQLFAIYVTPWRLEIEHEVLEFKPMVGGGDRDTARQRPKC